MKHRFYAFLLVPWLVFNASAQDSQPGQNKVNSGVTVAQQNAQTGPVGQLDFQTDPFTGRFGYQVPFELAPARHGNTPSLVLSYSSAGEDGWCGMGWDLSLGYIERETRKGVPVAWANGVASRAYDDSKGFNFNLNGRSSALVKLSATDYRAEIEGAFLKFQLIATSNCWVVIDKSGNKYYFGESINSRMSNTKSGWASNSVSGTFRWALDSVQSVQGDTRSIVYTSVSGSLYPQLMSYNGHVSGLGNSCTVQFYLADRTSDVRISLKSGYRVDLTKRLRAITHSVGGKLVWSNNLNYATSPSTQRSLLNSVTRYGNNGTSTLPPVSFSYSRQSFGFQSGVNWANLYRPTGGDASYYALSTTLVDLADMDGDGLPDRLIAPAVAPYTNWWVQKNTGAGFGAAVRWGPLGNQKHGSLTTSNDIYWASLQTTHGRLLDLNGDGKPDRICDPYEFYFDNPSSTNYMRLVVQLNDSTNLLPAFSWTNVVDQQYGADNNGQIGSFRAVENPGYVQMIDMNGDGLPDRVMMRRGPPYTYYVVQFNTGSGFTGTNAFGGIGAQGQTDSIEWAGLGGTMNYVRLLDINGDGLPDRVMLVKDSQSSNPVATSSQTKFMVELNNGYGFEPAMSWTGVDPRYNLICGGGYTQGYSGVVDDYELALCDVNGDGLPDRVLLPQCSPHTNWLVQINTGNGFLAAANWGPIYSQGRTSDDYISGIQSSSAMLLDINGDGLPDRVESKADGSISDNYLVVELSKGPFPDLLISASNGIGGSVSVAYEPSTQYDNRESTSSVARELLPFPVYTVSSISANDGINAASVTSYNYEGGMWNPVRREFDGFATTTVTDPMGMTNETWFHQAGGRNNSALGEFNDSINSIGKKGLPFRVDTIGSDGRLYKTRLDKIDEDVSPSGQHFAFTSQSIAMDYTGGSPNVYRATAEQFEYDTDTGNLTNQIHFGEVYPVNAATESFTDIGNDKLYQATTYASLSNTNILDKPGRSVLATDLTGQDILRETLCDYTGSNGNLVQKRQRMCDTCYVTNGFGYDSYNNCTSQTNEAGVVTLTVFDSTSQSYPAQETEGGTLVSTFNYDARSGKQTFSTDPKGMMTTNLYDPFFRILETDVSSVPNEAPTSWLTRYNYQLGMAGGVSTNSVRVRRSDGVDATNGHETWIYSDGFGRTIQVREEAEANGFRATDTVYDKRGNVKFATVPYFGSATTFTKPSGSKLGTLYAYDSIARITSLTEAVNGQFSSGQLTGTTASGGDTGSSVGSSSIAYSDLTDPWTLVVTDEASKAHKFSLDAYGRTNQIVEVTQNGNYTTRLNYNLAGDLLNVTDNALNKIEYSYNSLGQVVAMADPDMGVWQYQRDFAGRLRRQIDACGQTITFNYDTSLNRLLSRQSRDFTGALVSNAAYAYDFSDDPNFNVAKGELYKITDDQGWTKNSYDVRGRTVKTARYLSKNTTTYTNLYSYDDLNRVTLNTYPNGGPVITNVYDSGANLSQVKQVGASNTVFYAARGFNAMGQLLGVNFGNGVATTNDYFVNSHRLHRTVSFKSAATVQDLSYSYDQVANITGITDGAYSGPASAALSGLVYDDLHRLKSLYRPGTRATANFSYDSIGNLTQNGENGGATYNYGSRMPHAIKSVNGTNYAYDANGNMLVRGSQRLSYDPENHLTYVVTANSWTTFGYDGEGARLWKSSSGTNGLQVWIGANYEEKNGQILFHILADGLVCTFDKTGTNVFEYYQSDPLHSTSILTDGSGALSQHYEYMAFGQDRFTYSTTAFPVSRRFTSQVKDEETGLYYYGARYYDPELGRFIQPDSIIPNLFNPQSLNRYSYCLNNPLRYTDPTGHMEAEPAVEAEGEITREIRDSTAGLRNRPLSAQARFEQAAVRNADLKASEAYARSHGFSTTESTLSAPETAPNPTVIGRFDPKSAETPTIKSFQTYTKSGPEDVYSGRTSGTGTPEENVARRDSNHHMNEKGYGPAQLDKSSENANAIRGREQQLIEKNGGAKSQEGTSGNAVNGISDRNPKRDIYIKAAEKEFGN